MRLGIQQSAQRLLDARADESIHMTLQFPFVYSQRTSRRRTLISDDCIASLWSSV